VNRTRTSIVAALAAVLAFVAACTGPTKTEQPVGSAKPRTPVVSVDVDDLRRGRPPKLAWFSDSTLHQGSRTTTLPGEPPSEVAITPQRIVTWGPSESGENATHVGTLDADVTEDFPNPTSGLITNAQRNAIAWVADDGTPHVLQDGRPEPITLPRAKEGDSPQAVAILGHDCFNGPETVASAGCSVFFTMSHDRLVESVVSSNHGFVEKASEKITELQDVSPGLAMIGWADATGPRVCSRYESESGSYSTCDYMPRTFSPSGKRFIAFPSEIGEGIAADELSVRDADTGKAVITARSPKGTWTIWDAQWEDAAHVLAVVNQDERFFIVRVSLRGKVERAAGPVESTSANVGFAVQP
jgi:hypothetical protein